MARHPFIKPGPTVVIVLVAVVAIGLAYRYLLDWTEVTAPLPPEADVAFAVAREQAGGGTPYIEIDATGPTVHHDQEAMEARGFAELRLLAWSPDEQRLVRMSFPRWFVWLKTSSRMNLGTMIAATERDWAHLDLDVGYEDISLRGPGLLLDHRRADGSRLMLWTEGNGD